MRIVRANVMIFLASVLQVSAADFRCDLNAQGVKNFFERSGGVKTMEYFEYTSQSEHLIFFAATERLDPKLFGAGICDKTRLFIGEMQKQIATKLSTIDVTHKNTLAHALDSTSRHARFICNTCCALQLKVIAAEPLGTISAKTTFALLWPWVRVDAQKFYDNCCTDFYKNKSEDELRALFEATK